MQKFYYRLLALVAGLALVINITTFFAGFNSGQLTNISFFKERAAAEAYLIKHIVLDSGIYLKNTDISEIAKIIRNASIKYEINEQLLPLLIDTKNEFTVGLTGGMGISGICGTFFHQSGFSDPFNAEQNIFAAAETLAALQMKETPEENLPSTFILCGESDKIKTLYPEIYENAMKKDKTYSEIIRHAKF